MDPATTAATSPALPPTNFRWRDGSGRRPNQWTWFRRELQYDGHSPQIAHFAADPTARLLVNGKVVIARVMRYVRPQITVERVDLAPFLRQGKNAIVLLHHHWGVPTFQRSPGGAPGFSLVLDGETAEPTWRWRAAEQFVPHEHQIIGLDGARRIRFPVIMDARREDAAILQPGYDDSSWRQAHAVSHADWSTPILKETPPLDRQRHHATRLLAAGRCSTEAVSAAPIPEVPMSWLIKHGKYSADPLPASTGDATPSWTPPTDQDAYATFDFGKPLHGYVQIEIDEASAGTSVDVAYGELPPRADGTFDPEAVVGAPFCDRVILRGGAHRIEIPEERTWRYLMLVSRGPTSPLRVASVACMTSDHPVTVHGSYDGGPEHVAHIVRLCLDHARVTMSDAYVDTTGREDAQWLEDIEYRASLASRWFNDVALRQVTIRHAAEQQDPRGLFRVFAPEDYSTEGVQTIDWGMAWIGMLHDDWMWTGSTARLQRYFPSLERFLAALSQRVDEAGFLSGEATHSDIRIARRADAGRGERESIVNAWHYGYLRKAALLARTIKQDELAARWDQAADRLRTSFERFIVRRGEQTWVAEVWSPEAGAIDSYGQGATVSAVFHGLLDAETAKAAMLSAFVSPDGSPPAGVHRWNNPTYAYRVLDALCRHGFGAVAAMHLAERYGPYLPDGPLPEYFLPESQPVDPTGSHGWAAVPLLWLHESVLGVRLAKPGGDAISWSPVDVGWGRSCGTTMTPRGACEVQVDWAERSFSLRIPEGVTCDVALPQRLGTPSARDAVARDGFWRWTIASTTFETKLR